MKNVIEQGISQVPKEYGEVFVDPFQKIREALPNLPTHNARFVEGIINVLSKEKTTGRDLTALNSLAVLVELATTPQALKRQKERQSAQRDDMMEVMQAFIPRERVVIVKNLNAIQMTDGCTVGCAWCGAEAKRGIGKAFSQDSYERFVNEFGRHFPRKVNGIFFGLYEGSDPFDWVSEDGESDYTDLAEYFLKNTESPLCTSTAVPVGSELSIAKFLAQYALRSYKTAKRGGKCMELFRFSVTKDNKERVAQIMQFATDLNLVPDDFLKNIIKVVDRSEELRIEDLEEKDEEESGAIIAPVRRVGYFVNNKDREEDDIAGILCQDGLTISPLYSRTIRGKRIQFGGIMGKSVEAVTLRNSIGERRIQIRPAFMKIPHYTDHYSYEYGYKMQKKYFPILPKLTYDIYENGRFKGAIIKESVRRDALAFYFAYLNLTDWDVTVKGEEGYDSNRSPDKSFGAQLKKFISEFEERKESCIALFDSEPDQEAVEVAKKLIQKIEDWISDLDRRVEKSIEQESTASSNSIQS